MASLTSPLAFSSLLEQENTDYIIFEELAPDIFAKISELYKQYLSEKKGWNNLMVRPCNPFTSLRLNVPFSSVNFISLSLLCHQHDLVVKLFERGITREQIIQVFDDTPLTRAISLVFTLPLMFLLSVIFSPASMAAAVRLLHSKKADIRIVSDANTVYIDAVLRVRSPDLSPFCLLSISDLA